MTNIFKIVEQLEFLLLIIKLTWHNCSLCRYFYGPTLALQSENSWYNVLIEEDLENRAGEKNDTEPHPQMQCVCVCDFLLLIGIYLRLFVLPTYDYAG